MGGRKRKEKSTQKDGAKKRSDCSKTQKSTSKAELLHGQKKLEASNGGLKGPKPSKKRSGPALYRHSKLKTSVEWGNEKRLLGLKRPLIPRLNRNRSS